MSDDSHALAVEGTRFFGEMTASISHEIKNVLAIVNENAGLLSDLVAMSTRGMPLAPERLAGLAQSISRQVARGDRIVKGMNRFAHSADHAEERVDVADTVAFMADLAARLIALRGAAVAIDRPMAPVTVTTNRFFLENLVWRCLCRVMQACPPDQDPAIAVAISAGEAGARIRFQGPSGPPAEEAHCPETCEQALCRLLGARLSADPSNNVIGLSIP